MGICRLLASIFGTTLVLLAYFTQGTRSYSQRIPLGQRADYRSGPLREGACGGDWIFYYYPPCCRGNLFILPGLLRILSRVHILPSSLGGFAYIFLVSFWACTWGHWCFLCFWCIWVWRYTFGMSRLHIYIVRSLVWEIFLVVCWLFACVC